MLRKFVKEDAEKRSDKAVQTVVFAPELQPASREYPIRNPTSELWLMSYNLGRLLAEGIGLRSSGIPASMTLSE